MICRAPTDLLVLDKRGMMRVNNASSVGKTVKLITDKETYKGFRIQFL